MSKEKFYLPVSEDYTKFIGVTNSKEGVVIPIFFANTNRFHVTAYIKESESRYFFDAHLTDQLEKRHIPIFNAVITKDTLDDFGKKCQEFAQSLIPIVNKYQINIDATNKQDLYCIDCTLINNQLPNKFSEAKEFWGSLNSSSDMELISKHNQCTNKNHKISYDKANKRLICRMNNGIYLGFNNIDNLMKEIETLMMKHFSHEMSVIQETIADIVQAVTKECARCR